MKKGTMCIVVDTPWKERLPNGTKITFIRLNGTGACVFKRTDGALIFDDEPDGEFVLFSHEYVKEK